MYDLWCPYVSIKIDNSDRRDSPQENYNFEVIQKSRIIHIENALLAISHFSFSTMIVAVFGKTWWLLKPATWVVVTHVK